eukprot:scaffold987_cov183-Amphora_coffeaeformis.AAC.2
MMINLLRLCSKRKIYDEPARPQQRGEKYFRGRTDGRAYGPFHVEYLPSSRCLVRCFSLPFSPHHKSALGGTPRGDVDDGTAEGSIK